MPSAEIRLSLALGRESPRFEVCGFRPAGICLRPEAARRGMISLPGVAAFLGQYAASRSIVSRLINLTRRSLPEYPSPPSVCPLSAP